MTATTPEVVPFPVQLSCVVWADSLTLVNRNICIEEPCPRVAGMPLLFAAVRNS